MTVSEAMNTLAELREDLIMLSCDEFLFRKPDSKPLLSKRVQAIDIIIKVMEGAKAMTNRDKYILRRNEYDMLMSMQYELLDCCNMCILDIMTGSKIQCPEEMKGKVGARSRLTVCGECIQKWLNEETVLCTK